MPTLLYEIQVLSEWNSPTGGDFSSTCKISIPVLIKIPLGNFTYLIDWNKILCCGENLINNKCAVLNKHHVREEIEGNHLIVPALILGMLVLFKHC